uniref:Uncharacterized protein n=1 Tax=Rhizophora mucronata TaxID=61149 RepID=A0A2P2QB91_RHIMU
MCQLCYLTIKVESTNLLIPLSFFEVSHRVPPS